MVIRHSLLRLLFLLLFCFFGVHGGENGGDAAITTSLTYEYSAYSCESQEAIALLTVRTAKTTEQNPVLSLTSVMDISGSMGEGHRLTLLQGTNDYLVRELSRLKEPHKYGSVIFSGSSRELTALEVVTKENEVAIEEKINSTRPTGGTNLLDGIRRGVDQQIHDKDNRTYVRVVFVFTDGMPTEGVRDADIIESEVAQMIAENPGIAIYTFGFGDSVAVSILNDIAEVGNGIMYIITEESDFPKAFGAALGGIYPIVVINTDVIDCVFVSGLLTEVATDIKYNITPKAGTEILSVESGGTAVTEPDKTVIVHLGNMFLEERRDIVISFLMNKSCHAVDPLSVNGSFVDPVTAIDIEEPVPPTTIKRDPFTDEKRTGPTPVGAQKLRFQIAAKLGIIVSHLDQKDVAECIDLLKQLEQFIDASGYVDREEWVKDAKEDVVTLRTQLQVEEKVDGKMISEFVDVKRAVGEQRAGLCTGKIKSVEQVATPAVKKEGEAAKEKVLDMTPPVPFTLHLDHAIGDPVTYGMTTSIDAVFEIKDLSSSQAGSYPALSLITVLDRSGSMDGDALDLMIETQKRMIDWLYNRNESDISLGILLFSDGVSELQSLQNIHDIDIAELKTKLDGVTAAGGTSLGAALTQAVTEQLEHDSCSAIHAIFVLTDGVPSTGRDTIVPDLRKQLATANNDLYIYTFGLGQYDPELLKEISEVGHGESYILKSEVDIAYSFGDAIGGLLNVVARKIHVQFNFPVADVTLSDIFPDGNLTGKGLYNVSLENLIALEARDILVNASFPSNAVPEYLFNVSVSYTGSTSCGVAQHTAITIGTEKNKTWLAKQRLLEIQVVRILTDAIVVCTGQEDIAIAQGLIQTAIEVAAVANHIKAHYAGLLQGDLVSIQFALDATISGTMQREDACVLMIVLKDLLETQRSKSTAHATFQVEAFYDSTIRLESRTEFAKGLAKGPIRPKKDPFEISYGQSVKEIGIERMNVTIDITMKAIAPPTNRTPSTVVFAIDATKNVKPSEMQIMMHVMERVWKGYKDSKVFNTSELCVISYGVDAKVALGPKLFKDTTIPDIDSIFSTIRPGGKGNLTAALSAGFDVLAGTQVKGGDMIMVIFVAHYLSPKTSAADAERFTAYIESKVSFPVTCIPVLLPGIKKSYFTRYPPSVSTSLQSISGATYDVGRVAGIIKSSCLATASKRTYIHINPTVGVTLLGVGSGIQTKEGWYYLPDMTYYKQRTILVNLTVETADKPQILFMSSFQYYDIRSMSTWTMEAKPLVVKRIEKSVLKERSDLRKLTKEALREFTKQALAGHYGAALSTLGECLVQIQQMKSTDPLGRDIRHELEKLVSGIYDVIDEKKEISTVIKEAKEFWWRLDVKTLIPPDREVIIVKPPGEPVTEIKPSIPGETESRVSMDFSDVVTFDRSRRNITVPYELQAPLSTGRLITGHAVIIIDASATAENEINVGVASALLMSLSGRRGNRSVEIFSWNEQLTSIYATENLNRDDVDEAVQSIRKIKRSGSAMYRVVIDEGLQNVFQTTAPIEVMYWIATSSSGESDLDALLSSAAVRFADGCSPLTIFTFGANLKNDSRTFLTDLSQMTSGMFMKVDLDEAEASEREQRTRHVDIARSAVAWLETVFVKSIRIDLEPQDVGQIQSITTTDKAAVIGNNFIRIPCLHFGDSVKINLTIELVPNSNIHPATRRLLENENLTALVNISGQYYDVRSARKFTVEPVVLMADPVTADTLKHIQILEEIWDDSTNETLIRLGQNDVSGAQLSSAQSRLQGEISNVKERESIQKRTLLYGKIATKLGNFILRRKRLSDLLKATELIGILKDNRAFLHEPNPLLKTKSWPVSVTDENATLSVWINVTAPGVERPTPVHDIAMTVVFDAAAYTTLIDREVPVLTTQIDLAVDLIRRLIRFHDYTISLTAMEYRSGPEKTLPPIRITRKNLGVLESYFNQTKAEGYPANLQKGLGEGLASVLNNTDSSERVLVLFSSSFSVCVLDKPDFQKMMMPYITHPINPVKVMTYVVGPAETTKQDEISMLSGGSRFYINDFLHLSEAVDDTVKNLVFSMARGVRLSVEVPEWNQHNITVETGGMALASDSALTVAIPDLKIGDTHSIELKMKLDAWKGDAYIFNYTLSYFRTDVGRWYEAATVPVRAYRAPEDVILERTAAEQVAATAITTAAVFLADEDLDGAVDEFFRALQYLDQSPCQDDSYILMVQKYLETVYNQLLQQLRTKSPIPEKLWMMIEEYAVDFGYQEPVTVEATTNKENESRFNLAYRSLMFFGSIIVAYIIVLWISRY